jgi:hypothetical protein
LCSSAGRLPCLFNASPDEVVDDDQLEFTGVLAEKPAIPRAAVMSSRG